MPFAPFHEVCPDVARQETRTLTVLPAAKLAVPPAEYAFLELFCDEPGCDCRRVFFTVLSSKEVDVQAIIAWGWEDAAFYQRWYGGHDPEVIRDLQGPILNLASPQSKNAPGLLELARNVLLADPAYVERIKRHYALFRSKIEARGRTAAMVRKAKKKRKRL
jgi:hypothetical protein